MGFLPGWSPTKRFVFKVPLMHGQIIYIDKTATDTFIEFVLDENDNAKAARLTLISKEHPKLIEGINLEPKRINRKEKIK